MARSQAFLHFGIMKNLQGLSLEAKLLYIEVLIEPTVNQAGVGALRVSRWAREIELTEAETEKALAELDERRYVLVDRETDEILVRTLIRNDGVADQPNVLWAAVRAAVMCESPRLRAVLAEELRKLPPALPPKEGRNGRLFHYADPHAVADELDPPDPSRPGREPIENPSRTLPGPPDMTDPENPSRTHRGTPGGGGGGGGGGVTSRDGDFQERNARARVSDTQPLRAVPGGPPTKTTPPRTPLLALIADAPEVCSECAPLPPARRGPCGRCMGLRRAWEAERAAAGRTEADRRAAFRAAVDACPHCGPSGMRETPAGFTPCECSAHLRGTG